MQTEQKTDQLHRFLFNRADVRGEWVHLKHTYESVLSAQNYPAPVQKLLGEMLAATCLLTATLKFEGEVALQIQGEGALKYAVINGTHEQHLRAVARWDQSLSTFPDSFTGMLVKGVLVITITPKEGERYQGMVALDKDSLAACLQAYFEQSEQLATKLVLAADATQSSCAGMLLQVLPKAAVAVAHEDRQDFEHLSKLAETLTEQEMHSLAANELLYRLFHQEEVELFEPMDVQFSCSCSRERSAAAIANVDKAELLDIIAKDGEIKMNCQYCHAVYRFDAIDVESIHAGSANTAETSSH